MSYVVRQETYPSVKNILELLDGGDSEYRITSEKFDPDAWVEPSTLPELISDMKAVFKNIASIRENTEQVEYTISTNRTVVYQMFREIYLSLFFLCEKMSVDIADKVPMTVSVITGYADELNTIISKSLELIELDSSATHIKINRILTGLGNMSRYIVKNGNDITDISPKFLNLYAEIVSVKKMFGKLIAKTSVEIVEGYLWSGMLSVPLGNWTTTMI